MSANGPVTPPVIKHEAGCLIYICTCKGKKS